MKKILISIYLVLGIFLLPISSVLAVHVNGYYRSNGTYVSGYERTSPDSNPYNNYSYPGNYNPNTGKITGGNPDTYLNNYYNNSSSGSYYSYPSYTPPVTPTCPINSYYDGVSSCACNYGYAVSGGQCKSTTLICSDQIGLMSQYNVLTKKCECMSGYEYNGSSCVYKSTSYYSNYNSCPVNSHTSLTDSTKCSCDAGFTPNTAKDACVLIPAPPITNDQACVNKYGINSNWNGTLTSEGLLNCGCQIGYVWNTAQTACILPPVIPVITTASSTTIEKPIIDPLKNKSITVKENKTKKVIKKVSVEPIKKEEGNKVTPEPVKKRWYQFFFD